MPLYTLYSLCIIFGVELNTRKLESVIVAGYRYRTAAEVCIEYLIALFGKMIE